MPDAGTPGTDACAALPHYEDADGDGVGSIDVAGVSCVLPDGFVRNGEDCDDGCEDCFPGGNEVCDGRDNDRDGDMDGDSASRSCTAVGSVAEAICLRSECTVGLCQSGLADCDGDFGTGCETNLGTLSDCSGCGDSCGWMCSDEGCGGATLIQGGGVATCGLRDDGTLFCWWRVYLLRKRSRKTSC